MCLPTTMHLNLEFPERGEAAANMARATGPYRNGADDGA